MTPNPSANPTHAPSDLQCLDFHFVAPTLKHPRSSNRECFSSSSRRKPLHMYEHHSPMLRFFCEKKKRKFSCLPAVHGPHIDPLMDGTVYFINMQPSTTNECFGMCGDRKLRPALVYCRTSSVSLLTGERLPAPFLPPRKGNVFLKWSSSLVRKRDLGIPPLPKA